MEGFLIAVSNLPGNVFTILVMDSTGGKPLLCECHLEEVPSNPCLYQIAAHHEPLTFVFFLSGSWQPDGVQSQCLLHLRGPD